MFCWKLHENERIWTPGGRGMHVSLTPSLDPPMIAAVTIWEFQPPISVLTTQITITDWQTIIYRSPPPSQILEQKGKSNCWGNSTNHKWKLTLRIQAVRHSSSDVTLGTTSPSDFVTAKFSSLVVRQSTESEWNIGQFFTSKNTRISFDFDQLTENENVFNQSGQLFLVITKSHFS